MIKFMEIKINKFIYWMPRILSILFICFLALFSLDIFEMKLGFWGTILGLFMHNIPVLILSAVLIVSWKHEIVGGVAFIIAGMFFAARIIMTLIMNQFELDALYQLIIAAPAFLIGILFLIGWFKKKKISGE